MSNENSNSNKFWKFIGIIGAIASILGLAYALWPNKQTYDIEVTCSNYEKLTKENDENISQKFEAKYFYENEQVDDLWRMQLSFENKSNNTIISSGALKNIANDSSELVFTLLEGITIMEANKQNSTIEFPHDVEINQNKIKVKFKQWRPSEKAEYSFYIASLSKEDTSTVQSKKVIIPEETFSLNRIFKEDKYRQIINGDIIYKVKSINESEIDPYTEIKSLRVVKTFGAIGKFFLYFLILGFGLIFITSPYSYVKKRKWTKNNQQLLKEHLKQIYPGNSNLINKYSRSPQKMPRGDWVNFKGDKYPKLTFDSDTNNFVMFLWTFIIMGVITLSLFAVLIL